MKTETIVITPEVTEVLYGMCIKQHQHIKRLRLQPGQTMFRLNVETGVIDTTPTEISTALDKHNKEYKIFHMKYEMGYLYLPALRLETAFKKFRSVVYYAIFTLANKPKEKVQEAQLSSLQGCSENC